MKGTIIAIVSIIIMILGIYANVKSSIDMNVKYIQATNDLEQVYYTNQLMSAEIAHLEWVIERVHKDQTGEDL